MGTWRKRTGAAHDIGCGMPWEEGAESGRRGRQGFPRLERESMPVFLSARCRRSRTFPVPALNDGEHRCGRRSRET